MLVLEQLPFIHCRLFLICQDTELKFQDKSPNDVLYTNLISAFRSSKKKELIRTSIVPSLTIEVSHWKGGCEIGLIGNDGLQDFTVERKRGFIASQLVKLLLLPFKQTAQVMIQY